MVDTSVDVESALRTLLIEHAELAPGDIGEFAAWENLGVDSLVRIELLMFMEEKLDCDLDQDTLMPTTTFGETVKEIERQVREAAK